MNQNILPNIHCFAECLFDTNGYEAPRVLYDNEMVYVSQGKNNITVNSTLHIIGAGEGIIIPPQVSHFSENPYPEPALRHCVHFDWYGTQPIPERLFLFLKYDKRHAETCLNTESPILFTLPPERVPLMDRALSLLRNKPPAVISQRYALGELLAYIVSDNTSRGSRDATALERLDIMNELKNYIEGNYNTAIDYRNFCMVTQRSAAYLCANFKKVTGLSPTEYLIAVRLFHAERLLKNTILTIDQICEQVGIPNHNYFSRLFKKRNKMSPSEYRKK